MGFYKSTNRRHVRLASNLAIPVCRRAAVAFSMVEVLITVTVLGIIVFLALPNIVQVRQDSEDNLARARAEAMNVAAVSYFQALGRSQAKTIWENSDDDERFELLRPYLAFAPTNLSQFVPSGYSVTFATNPLQQKASLFRGSAEAGTLLGY